MNENEILGFDPAQLTVFNQEENVKSTGNSNIYRMRPAEAVSEDGIYRATIKVIYNPFNLANSILEQQSYGLQDENGWFSVVSSLTDNNTDCPIFKAWKKCHYAEKGSTLWKQAARVEEGGEALFDKRFARFVTIQVITDKNHPELEGRYMFWKLPKAIWDVINNKMNPSKESGKPRIPVMDFLFGRAIDIEVIPGPGKVGDERYSRETKYMGELSEDVVSCVNPDGSPILNDEEQDVLDMYVMKISKVWKEKDPERRLELETALKADPISAQLKTIYSRVLEEIKKVCPNLITELGYKEWSDETKARVQSWINCVLSGNNPAAMHDKNIVDSINTINDTKEENVESPIDVTQDAVDDLPF